MGVLSPSKQEYFDRKAWDALPLKVRAERKASRFLKGTVTKKKEQLFRTVLTLASDRRVIFKIHREDNEEVWGKGHAIRFRKREAGSVIVTRWWTVEL